MIIYLHTHTKIQANSHRSVHIGCALQLNWAAQTHARHGWSNFNILCYQFSKSTKSPWKNSKIVPADFTRSSHRLRFIASVHTCTQKNEFNTLTNIHSIDNKERERDRTRRASLNSASSGISQKRTTYNTIFQCLHSFDLVLFLIYLFTRKYERKYSLSHIKCMKLEHITVCLSIQPSISHHEA